MQERGGQNLQNARNFWRQSSLLSSYADLECDLLPIQFSRVFTGALRNLIERQNYE